MMKFLRHQILCLCISLFPLIGNAATIYVDTGATGGSNNGASWSNAYTDLQDAIDAAVAGDEIWVVAGLYKPTKDLTGNALPADNRSKTFYINTDGIMLYGGFLGTETMLSERDVTNNVTTLSGDFNDDDVVTGAGATLSITGKTENAHHVIHIDATTASGNISNATLVDGFTITAGNPTTLVGGGILIDAGLNATNEASPLIQNCHFYANNESAILIYGESNGTTSPIISDCSFQQNYATNVGSAISISSGSLNSVVAINNSSFTQNNGQQIGAIHVGAPSTLVPNMQITLNIDKCTFTENAAGFGSGISIFPLTPNYKFITNITNSVFSQNSANLAMAGGTVAAFFVVPGDAIFHIENTQFIENQTVDLGGALLSLASNPNAQVSWDVFNSTFIKNQADKGGAISKINNGTITSNFVNTTFYKNSATTSGQTFYESIGMSASTTDNVTNSIIWNDGTQTGNLIYDNDGTGTINSSMNYSIFDDGMIDGALTLPSGITGSNNLDADPLFTDPANNDLTLQSSSPAIDVGDNAANNTTTDLAGNARISNNTIDMGAYENPCTPGSITTEPSDQTICEGASTTFTVAATGTGLTYQWQSNEGGSFANLTDGGAYSGATAATLTVATSNTSLNTVQYQCVLTGDCTSATSTTATLTVNQDVSITTQPAASTVCEGANTSFTVAATGTGVTYQWQDNSSGSFMDITGETNAILSLSAVSATMDGTQYQCVISATCSTAASNAATLTVNQDVSITTQPAASTVCEGANTSFTTAATGTGVTYQWQDNSSGSFMDITGETSGTLSLSSVTTTQSGTQYQCVVTGTCSTSTSSTAVLTVNLNTVITTQSTASTVCEGANTSFTVAATGTSVTYQWQDNTSGSFADITGETGVTLSLSAVSSAMNGTQYQCVVTGTCSTSTSSTATLTLNEDISITTQPTASTVCEGANTNFTTAATGTGVTYQWQDNTSGSFADITGETSTTLNLSAVSTAMNGTQYQCVVTGTCSTSTSNTATLTVNENVTITTQPTASTICEGANTSFSTAATGTGVTYQWQDNTSGSFADITGETNTTLSLSAVSATMNGTQYQCVVTGTCSTSTSNTATLTVNENVSITTQPTASTVCEGANTSFTTAATGTSVTYQWQDNTSGSFADITGETSATLNLSAVSTTMNGTQYQCVVTGTCTTSTSSIATLTVNENVSITTQPTASTICEGVNTSFSTAATGTGVTYQWQDNTSGSFADITGETSATLSLSAVSATMNGTQYQCVVTGTCTTITSSTAALTVNLNTVITTQPTDQTICEGSNTSFTVAAIGTGITYQWQDNTSGSFAGITGETSATLSLSAVSVTMDGTKYRCVVTGTCTTVTSSAATLNVNINTSITTQPSDQTVCEGLNTSFATAVTGTGVTYQWQDNTSGSFADIAGETGTTLSLSAVSTAMNGTQYQCVVTGTCNAVTSSATTLNVNINTSITTQPTAQTICEGSNTSFTVAATGTGTLTYQWQMQNGAGYSVLTDNATFSGTNTATLTIAGVNAGLNNRSFHCVVTGLCSITNSNDALLTVTNSASNVTLTSPTNKTVCEGIATTFSVATASSGLTYQWQANSGSGFANIADGSNYTGANMANLNVNNPTLTADGTSFQCLVTVGSCGVVTSGSATLSVLSNASITTQPSSVSGLCVGDNTSFTVASSSTSSTYQWQVNLGSGFLNMSNSATYSGVMTPTLSVNNVGTGMNAYQYRCVVINACPSDLNSDVVTIGVDVSPLNIDAVATYTATLTTSETASVSLSDLLLTPITHPCGITTQSISAGTTNYGCVHVGSSYPVTISATAGNGATANTTVMVTVTDPNSYCCQAPQLLCNSTIPLTLTGNTVTLDPAMVIASSTAPCGIQSVSLSQSTFDCSHVGLVTPITYTLTDNQGQTASCTSTVVVTDGDNPTAMCVAPFSVYLDNTGHATINTAMINNGSSDNCTSNSNLVVAISRTDFDCSDIGITSTITLTVQDAAGNMSSCSTMVTVLPSVNEVVGTRSIAIADAIIGEGNAGTSTLDFTVSLSGSVICTPITLDFATSDSTALAGFDYVAQTGSLTFAQGETNKTISIEVNGDTDIETAQEEFKLLLSNIQGAIFTDSVAIGHILDDEIFPTLSVDDVTGNEGDASVTFTVSLSAASTLPISVAIETGDLTALAATDYTHTEDTLHFAPGETSASFTVPLLDDSNFDEDKTFTVTLSSPINATLTDPMGLATITDNETAQCLDLVVTTIDEGGNGASGLSYGTLTIDATTSGNTGPFTYEWDAQGYLQFNIIEEGVLSVIHTNEAMWSVTITDASGNCSGIATNELVGGTVEVNVLTIDQLNITSSNCDSNNGAITLSVIGTGGNYEFAWSNNFVDTDQDGDGASTVSGLGKGWYSVVVTDLVTGESITEWIWVPCSDNTGGVRGKDELVQAGLTTNIAPNPFEQSTTISLKSKRTQTVQVRVLSLNGQIVAELFQGTLDSNTIQPLYFEAQNLHNGLYLLQIIDEQGGVYTDKLILQR